MPKKFTLFFTADKVTYDINNKGNQSKTKKLTFSLAALPRSNFALCGTSRPHCCKLFSSC